MTREGNCILEESGPGTTFSIRGIYETAGITAPSAHLARWLTRRIVGRRLLPQLKAAVES